jgi:glyoxylase-like metal-dependent hydrolase (beta-lactamase superfamily II)
VSRAARPIRIEPLHLADFIHPAGSPLAGETGVVMGYAVVHPDGVVLFDTGIGFGDPDIEAAYRPTVRSVAVKLRERSIEPDEVVAIATSHLHFDHCGQNQAFPGIPIHVRAAEYAAAHAADYTIPGWVDFPGAQYELHEAGVELLPGIRLLPSPGHTPGHQAMLVEAPDGRTLLVGQAAYTAAEWEGSDDPAVSGLPGAPDPPGYRASREALRALRPDRVMFGHDLAVVGS